MRLTIMDPGSGTQTLVSANNNIVVAVNVKICNFKELYVDLKDLGIGYASKFGSDCKVFLSLFKEYGPA